MSKKFGFDLLVDQATDAVARRMSFMTAAFQDDPRSHLGDSPIERLLYLALFAHTLFEEPEWFWKLERASVETLEEVKARIGFRERLILQRQVEINTIGRVDFLVHAYGDWAREPEGGLEGWRRLIIECDGHNFHTQSKEQVARDRSRDRNAAMMGLEVFRFTGSELWRDPWGCAGQIIAWANRGV